MIGVTHSGSRLPLELIFRIAELAIYDVSAAEYYGPWYRGKKTLWRTVEALSTSSKAYRAVTMEIWFRMVVISEPRELHTLLHNYPSAARWIRQVHQLPIDSMDLHLSLQSLDFAPLPNVTSLRFVTGADGPYTLNQYFNARNIVNLSLEGYIWPTPHAVQDCLSAFPCLQTLSMDLFMSWCSLCNNCEYPSFGNPPPETLVYTGGMGLPYHYGHLLTDCESLQTLLFTVVNWEGGSTTLRNTATGNPDLWSGECDDCIKLMYPDAQYREDNLKRKKGEEGNGLPPYVKLPSLSRVEWRFRMPRLDERHYRHAAHM